MDTRQFLSYIIVFLIGFIVAAMIVPTSFDMQLNQITGADIIGKEAPLTKVSTNIVAVSSENNQGILGKVNVEIISGDGKILVNTNPFFEPDTQYSANIAAKVAQRVSITKLKDKDLIYDFDVPAVNVVGGPSSGAAMTIATISALLEKNLRNDVVVTGTINIDGTIGHIGGILEKAQAVVENNKKIFLIPKGQSQIISYEKQTKTIQRNGVTFKKTVYVPTTFDLIQYAKDELNLDVIEVENIYDVMKIMLKD